MGAVTTGAALSLPLEGRAAAQRPGGVASAVRGVKAVPAEVTPLWPAGHLPLKGGDQVSWRLSPIAFVGRMAATLELPISPLEGEMAGRPEGGPFPTRRFP